LVTANYSPARKVAKLFKGYEVLSGWIILVDNENPALSCQIHLAVEGVTEVAEVLLRGKEAADEK
jgi:hypothetical protein